MIVEVIPCLSDNYSYLIHEKESNTVSIIDPSEFYACEEIIKNFGETSLKDMGKVMGELKKNHADTVDFSKAGQIIKNLLNS